MIPRNPGFINFAVIWALAFGCGKMQSPMAFGAEAMPPSATEGYQLSDKLCRSCHLIDTHNGGTAQIGPPPFTAIANKPGQSAQHIENVLIQSHPPMPDLHLSNRDIMNIIAYLDTLRWDQTVPPLLPPKGEGVPQLPEPS